jgi:hypothetical protein
LTINFNGKQQERQDKPESIDDQLLRQQAEKEQQQELINESEASDSENDDGKNDDSGDDKGNGCISGNVCQLAFKFNIFVEPPVSTLTIPVFF